MTVHPESRAKAEGEAGEDEEDAPLRRCPLASKSISPTTIPVLRCCSLSELPFEVAVLLLLLVFANDAEEEAEEAEEEEEEEEEEEGEVEVVVAAFAAVFPALSPSACTACAWLPREPPSPAARCRRDILVTDDDPTRSRNN